MRRLIGHVNCPNQLGTARDAVLGRILEIRTPCKSICYLDVCMYDVSVFYCRVTIYFYIE